MPISRTDFLGLMTKLCIAFTTRNDPSRLEVYWQALNQHTREQLTAAVEAQINGSAHFPRIAALRESVSRLTPIAPWRDRPQPEASRADPRHVAAAFALIHRITREHLSPALRLGEFERMHREFPAHGWDDAADETRPLVDLAAYRAQQAREEDF